MSSAIISPSVFDNFFKLGNNTQAIIGFFLAYFFGPFSKSIIDYRVSSALLTSILTPYVMPTLTAGFKYSSSTIFRPIYDNNVFNMFTSALVGGAGLFTMYYGNNSYEVVTKILSSLSEVTNNMSKETSWYGWFNILYKYVASIIGYSDADLSKIGAFLANYIPNYLNIFKQDIDNVVDASAEKTESITQRALAYFEGPSLDRIKQVFTEIKNNVNPLFDQATYTKYVSLFGTKMENLGTFYRENRDKALAYLDETIRYWGGETTKEVEIVEPVTSTTKKVKVTEKTRVVEFYETFLSTARAAYNQIDSWVEKIVIYVKSIIGYLQTTLSGIFSKMLTGPDNANRSNILAILAGFLAASLAGSYLVYKIYKTYFAVKSVQLTNTELSILNDFGKVNYLVINLITKSIFPSVIVYDVRSLQNATRKTISAITSIRNIGEPFTQIKRLLESYLLPSSLKKDIVLSSTFFLINQYKIILESFKEKYGKFSNEDVQIFIRNNVDNQLFNLSIVFNFLQQKQTGKRLTKTRPAIIFKKEDFLLANGSLSTGKQLGSRVVLS